MFWAFMSWGLQIQGVRGVATVGLFGLFNALSGHTAPPQSPPPRIVELLKPAVYARVMNEKAVMTYASLTSESKEISRYRYYVAMRVGATKGEARRALTDYKLYKEMIPYVDRAEFSPSTRILQIEGGIWKYRLTSSIRFDESGGDWIRYEVIQGHFKGLKGDLFFESAGEMGTLVMMRGEVTGNRWPPRFVIERGAEIVFGFTGQRMRSYIESSKKENPGGKDHDGEIPQPRRRF